MTDGPLTPPGFTVRSRLGIIGRAVRYAGTDGRELWRLPRTDGALSERLRDLGAQGVSGFTGQGQDREGVWLVRAASGRTLRNWMGEHPGPCAFRDALQIAIAIARALAVCEKETLSIGPLVPAAVGMGERRAGAFLIADPLVAAWLGAKPPALEVSPRWLPPEQASGEPWDEAASRYSFGLILYRLLAGQDAFRVQGLRLGFEEQLNQGAPPFAPEIARALPPGLQSLCLDLLHPRPERRPKSAQLIADSLGAFLKSSPRRAAAPFALQRSPDPYAVTLERKESQRTPTSKGRPARRRWLTAALPVALAGAIAVGLALQPSSEAERRPLVRTPGPLGAGRTQSSDCAACHARQVGEWRRSVMAHAGTSPLFQALEILIEEQVGRSLDCPEGAGILRKAEPSSACRDRASGLSITGSGGEHWCVNCHTPGENLSAEMPAWQAAPFGDRRTRQPLRDSLGSAAMEGISCAFCHQVTGSVHPAAGGVAYQGNPSWFSARTGRSFDVRIEDRAGVFGISNSGYQLDPSRFLLPARGLLGGAHAATPDAVRRFRASSEFCGSCHDVRLFGTDVIGRGSGEHFKRLRNAYSEWVDWAALQARTGQPSATCQGCHMSTFPGVCTGGAAASRPAADDALAQVGQRVCPPGTHFEARAPGMLAEGRVAGNSAAGSALHAHYFSGVDVPLAPEFQTALLSDRTLDGAGIPLGARERRDLLLASSVRFSLGAGVLRSGRLELPVLVENVGAGHRVPAGFSQERELWVELHIIDRQGATVYEVGHVEQGDEDLHDKVFLRVNTSSGQTDSAGRPLGLFGADVADGSDVPRWRSENVQSSAQAFRGRGLINFQNGFLRCVRCIGIVDEQGRCQPLPGQERARGDRFADGDYDVDTGACESNLQGSNALFETYFPVGALDASRGVLKAPDAIVDTRSLAPRVLHAYTYDLPVARDRGPLRAVARLLFRAFPPYLVRAFVAYEAERAALGARPSGPLIDAAALERLEIVELARAETVIE